MKQKTALVIGSGVAGLAASIRLARMGMEVVCLEANAYIGGKLSVIEGDGFCFDAGPSLFTMPHLVDELFELCGYKASDYFNYHRLDTICQYFYPDGLHILAHRDPTLFAAEIEQKTGHPAGQTLDYLAACSRQYSLLGNLFMNKPLRRLSTFLNKNAFKAYFRLPSLGLFETMHQRHSRFFKDPRLVQLFDRYATYNGSSPYQTPGLLSMIAHLEYGKGAFLPHGGMRQISASLFELAKKQGVRFETNTKVSTILVENKKAIGVQTENGKNHIADYIICNMDMVAAYKKLLPTQKQPRMLLSQPKSSSALIFYWGINHNFVQLDLHNIFFSNDYQYEFSCIFDKKIICPDPTVYLNITSVFEPADAPKNAQNWFVMVNVPNNSGQDWDALIRECRQNILNKLSRMLGQDIASLIVYEHILEPRSIETRTSSWQGALYGNSSNNAYSAFLRHPNHSPYLKNLYFCGGSVHPGGGVPLSLLSAKIVADLIKKQRQ